MSNFLISYSGQIESAQIPQVDSLYCKFSIVAGQDWTVLSGTKEGITQQSMKPLSSTLNTCNSVNAFNFPIDIDFKSTNAFGWPQIILSVYGPDFMGRDVARGYGSAYLPRIPGKHTLYIPLFVPLATSPMNQCLSFIAGKLPEFIDPTFVSKSEGREVTRVQSHGAIKIQVYMSAKNLEAFGYRV